MHLCSHWQSGLRRTLFSRWMTGISGRFALVTFSRFVYSGTLPSVGTARLSPFQFGVTHA